MIEIHLIVLTVITGYLFLCQQLDTHTGENQHRLMEQRYKEFHERLTIVEWKQRQTTKINTGSQSPVQNTND
jgi:hypothetical protein